MLTKPLEAPELTEAANKKETDMRLHSHSATYRLTDSKHPDIQKLANHLLTSNVVEIRMVPEDAPSYLACTTTYMVDDKPGVIKLNINERESGFVMGLLGVNNYTFTPVAPSKKQKEGGTQTYLCQRPAAPKGVKLVTNSTASMNKVLEGMKKRAKKKEAQLEKDLGYEFPEEIRKGVDYWKKAAYFYKSSESERSRLRVINDKGLFFVTVALAETYQVNRRQALTYWIRVYLDNQAAYAVAERENETDAESE